MVFSEEAARAMGTGVTTGNDTVLFLSILSLSCRRNIILSTLHIFYNNCWDLLNNK